MPKAIIEFNLPDEQPEYDAIMNAKKEAQTLHNVVYEIYGLARNELKHGQRTVESMEEVLEKIRVEASKGAFPDE
jgi:hypothetical protein